MSSSTSSFRRFARTYLIPWLVFTIGFGLALDLLVAEVLIPRTPGSAAKIQRLLRSTDPDEIAVFGSSRAEGDIVPSEIGPHVYNYGLSGTEFEVTEVLLDIELSKAKRSAVIINFDPDFFDPHPIGDVNAFVPFCDHPSIEALMRRAGVFHTYQRIPGLRFYGAYELYLKDLMNAVSSPTKEFERGASLEKNRLPPDRFAAAIEQRLAWRGNFVVPADKDARLRELLGRRPERAIIVVFAPYHRSFYEAFTDLPKVLAYLADLERAHPNVTTFFFDGRWIDDGQFFDTAHLNAAGARTFSKELRRRLDQRGIAL